MSCQKYLNEIEERDLRRESLSGAAEAHLETCAGCRVFHAERLALHQLIGDLEKFPAPADFDFRMRARLSAELNARASRLGWFNFSPAALSWPLAGCLALLISTSLYFQQRQDEAPSAAPSALTGRTITATPAPDVREVRPVIVKDKIIESASSSNALANRNAQPSRRRMLPEQNGANRRGENAKVQGGILESNTAGVTGAPVIFAATGASPDSKVSNNPSEMMAVQLAMPERPLKVLLRDPSGAARTISVDSVSFGSRDVVERSATFKPVSLSTNQGVW